METTMDSPLAIYLADHLMGATAGRELARRIARAHRQTERRDCYERLAIEINEDRDSLLRIMGVLHVPVRRYKVGAAWLAEKVGRLKLNGQLLSRAPLSGLVELEILKLGVSGKAAAWRSLRAVAEHDGRLDPAALDALLDRAQQQEATLEELRAREAANVFALPGDR
jgi:hypothetical protein